MALPNLPVYVTRKTAAGQTGDFSLSPGLAVTIFLLIVLNVLGWSIFGLVALAFEAANLVG